MIAQISVQLVAVSCLSAAVESHDHRDRGRKDGDCTDMSTSSAMSCLRAKEESRHDHWYRGGIWNVEQVQDGQGQEEAQEFIDGEEYEHSPA